MPLKRNGDAFPRALLRLRHCARPSTTNTDKDATVATTDHAHSNCRQTPSYSNDAFLVAPHQAMFGRWTKRCWGVSCCTKSDPFEVKRGRACRQNRERSCFSKNVHLDDVSVAPGFGRALCSPTKFWNGKRRSSSRHCLRQQVKRNSHVVWKHRCCQALRNRFRSSAKC